MEKFYTYLWLRYDGSPYYVGKGTRNRAYTNFGHRVKRPAEDKRILLQFYATEEDAFRAEIFLISLFGRKDLGTGRLLNLTAGGENPPRACVGKKMPAWSEERRQRMIAAGWPFNRGVSRFPTDEQRKKMSVAHRGKPRPWRVGVKLNISEATKEKMKEIHANQVPWNKGLKSSQPAWNKGIKCPQIAAKMIGNTNGKYGRGGKPSAACA